MKKKSSLLLILISVVIVLGVNIAGNYNYYNDGNDWHYSVFFVLSITALGWLLGMPAGIYLKKIFMGNLSTMAKLSIAMLIMVLHGTVLMIGTMKAMVLLFHFPEQSTANYVNNTTYAVLLSLIIGLMTAGQQFLTALKKNADDRENMIREMTRSQYEALKNQVNPHFLFNSLNTLTVMIPRQPELAVKFVEQMSNVFRYSLQNSDENTIDVASELKVVRSFLFLNEQRFEGKLNVAINVSDDVLKNRIITNSLLMLAENAIKHNEISTSKPLTISIYSEDKYLVMKNTMQQKTQLEPSTQVGLANIQKRYEIAGTSTVIIEETNDSFIVKLPLL